VTATGIGSMPGTDIVETVRVVVGELPDFVYLPELPERGAPATMTGRGAAMLSGLAADLQPAGWRIQESPGVDHRRAVSTLARDLDALEEHTQGYTGRLKVQVVGPLTLAAAMERPRGDKVLADFGARRDLAQSLTEGVADHVRGVSARVPGARLLVQVDEPALTAVLAGAVPTASGFSRHRSVAEPEAREALARLVAAIVAAGAVPVVHVCAADVPVALLAQVGFSAVSFDLSQVTPGEPWALAYEGGIALWPGAVPAMDPDQPPTASALVAAVLRFFAELGVTEEQVADRLVVTPACGLAGASPTWARDALRLSREVAQNSVL